MGKWGGAERSWGRGNQDQNVLYEKLFSIQLTEERNDDRYLCSSGDILAPSATMQPVHMSESGHVKREPLAGRHHI